MLWSSKSTTLQLILARKRCFKQHSQTFLVDYPIENHCESSFRVSENKELTSLEKHGQSRERALMFHSSLHRSTCFRVYLALMSFVHVCLPLLARFILSPNTEQSYPFSTRSLWRNFIKKRSTLEGMVAAKQALVESGRSSWRLHWSRILLRILHQFFQISANSDFRSFVFRCCMSVKEKRSMLRANEYEGQCPSSRRALFISTSAAD